MTGDGTAAHAAAARHQAVREIIDRLVGDLIETTAARVDAAAIETIDDVRAAHPRIAGYSDPVAAELAELKARLMDRLYRHQRVRRMGAKAGRVLRGLFRAYEEDVEQLPDHVTARVGDGATMARVIADYIAGMTDRFALEEYAKLYDPFERV